MNQLKSIKIIHYLKIHNSTIYNPHLHNAKTYLYHNFSCFQIILISSNSMIFFPIQTSKLICNFLFSHLSCFQIYHFLLSIRSNQFKLAHFNTNFHKSLTNRYTTTILYFISNFYNDRLIFVVLFPRNNVNWNSAKYTQLFLSCSVNDILGTTQQALIL